MADGNDYKYAPRKPHPPMMQIHTSEDDQGAMITGTTTPRNAVPTGKYQIHRDLWILDGMDDVQEFVTLYVCRKSSCDEVATYFAYNAKDEFFVCKAHLADAMAAQTAAFSILPSSNGFVAGVDHRV